MDRNTTNKDLNNLVRHKSILFSIIPVTRIEIIYPYK